MRYFTSDLHFGHKAIIEFCGRPFMSLEDMNEALVWSINNVCGKSDLLYILGDVSFLESTRNVYVSRINCPIVLIRGNHDHSNRIKGLPYQEVYKELDIELGKHIVTLSHFPYKWQAEKENTAARRLEDKYAADRPIDYGRWLLHGHTHAKERINREQRMIHVGVDAWHYSPVSELDIVKLIENKD